MWLQFHPNRIISVFAHHFYTLPPSRREELWNFLINLEQPENKYKSRLKNNNKVFSTKYLIFFAKHVVHMEHVLHEDGSIEIKRVLLSNISTSSSRPLETILYSLETSHNVK